MMEDIYKLIRGIKGLPPAPQVLPRILEALSCDSTTLDEMGELIALEPVLTAKLLQYSNSAYYRGTELVSSVPEAIGRVGFQTVFTLVSSATSHQNIKLPANCGLDAAKLWKHSVTTAFSCKFIAEDINLNSNLLFTGGMLHDIGRVVIANSKGAEYGQLLVEAFAKMASTCEYERTAYGFTHADVGACLLETWKLPPLLTESVCFHHCPVIAGPARMTAACICVGNAVSHRFDHPDEVPRATNPELESAMDLLGMDESNLATYQFQLHENWEYVNNLIQLR